MITILGISHVIIYKSSLQPQGGCEPCVLATYFTDEGGKPEGRALAFALDHQAMVILFSDISVVDFADQPNRIQ